MYASHAVEHEPLSIRERMTQVLTSLQGDEFVDFVSLFSSEEGRDGVIVTFIAVLELLKDRMIEIVQSEVFAPIYVKPADRHIEEGSQDGE